MIPLNYNSMLPLNTLYDFAEKHSQDYKEAKPFAHSILDGAFDEDLLTTVIEEFNLSNEDWKGFDTKYEKKLQMNKDLNLKPVTRALIHNLNSAPFLDFLTQLTGIEGLIPDPYLEGGGLHKIEKGGKLGIHVDFNRHKAMSTFRRLNVIIYLNKDWKEEYGGHFELWDENQNGCVTKVLPVFNRMAIFTTTSTSFHGHPKPLTCPDDRHRISLALYYYTATDRGEQAETPHSTVFLDKAGSREELHYTGNRLKRAIKILLGKE